MSQDNSEGCKEQYSGQFCIIKVNGQVLLYWLCVDFCCMLFKALGFMSRAGALDN